MLKAFQSISLGIYKLFSDGFVRSATILSSGLIVSQIILISFAPIITRIYNPSEMGVLSAFNSALGILLIASCWRYERAIPIVGTRRIVMSLLWISIIVLIINTVLLSGVIFFLKKEIADFIKMPLNQNYLWFLPGGLLFAGVYELLTFVAVRDSNYNLLAKTKIFQSISQVLFQISIGIIGQGPSGLIVGSIAGRSVGVHTLISAIKGYWALRPRRFILAQLWSVTKRYWQFPVYSTPAGVLNKSASAAPHLLFLSLYDAQVAGFLFLAEYVIHGPLTFIGNSVAKVFLGYAGSGIRKGGIDLGKLVNKTLFRLLLLSALPISLIYILGPDFFKLVFGQQWIEAGSYARLLAFALWLQFSIAPLMQTLIVLERQGAQIVFDFLRFVLVTGSILSVHFIGLDARDAVFAYGLSLTVTYLLGYAIVRWQVTKT